MCGNPRSKADIIPVDIVSNSLIAASAYRANLKTYVSIVFHQKYILILFRNEIPIIHCCSGELNPVKWNRVANYLEQFYFKYPLDQCYRVPSTYFHTSRALFLLNFFAKHYIPSYMLDIVVRLMRKNAKYVKLYGKVWRMIETLHYFTMRGWTFESNNIITLWNSMSAADQKVSQNIQKN